MDQKTLARLERPAASKGEHMRKNVYLITVATTFLLVSVAQAQVKQVEMHIGGYLCGN